MMMKALGIFIPLAAALTAAAQDKQARPAFEVESVKPAEAPETKSVRGMKVPLQRAMR